MPDCQLRPATADDAPIVYALICELKQAEFVGDSGVCHLIRASCFGTA